MLDSWLPFLIYGLLALGIPASMMWMSFKFSQRPGRRTRRPRVAVRSGGLPRPPPGRAPGSVRVGCLGRPASAAALQRQLLADGDALHRLRHRDRLSLSARGA